MVRLPVFFNRMLRFFLPEVIYAISFFKNYTPTPSWQLCFVIVFSSFKLLKFLLTYFECCSFWQSSRVCSPGFAARIGKKKVPVYIKTDGASFLRFRRNSALPENKKLIARSATEITINPGPEHN